MKNRWSVVAAVTIGLVTVAADGATGGSVATVSVDQPTLKVIGPVEAYDAKHGIARVLGQTVLVTHATELAVGELVSVVGTEAEGKVVASAIKDEGLYVPGSSHIFLSGSVQKVNAALGTAVVNGITVDFTPLLADGQILATVGAALQISGTQPATGGVVLAAAIGAKANSISGVGAHANSISGVGAQANSISGVGAVPNSISGVGAQANSISGVGAVPNSISGVGAQANSISGVGAVANSISGVGAQANSISGVGTVANSISGVGAKVNSISGVGAVSDSISGVGAQAQ